MESMDAVRLSYSQLATWRSCRRKWYLSYVERLEPKNVHPAYALVLGSAVHEALDAYYEPKNNRDRRKLILTYEKYMNKEREAAFALVKGLPEEDEVKEKWGFNEDLGYAMLEHYGTVAHELDNFEVLATEASFELDTGITTMVDGVELPVLYRGRIDGVVQTDDDHIMLLEHKTAKQFNDQRLILDQQATSYIWAARKIHNLPVEGVIYNILRKQRNGPRVKAPLVYRLEAWRSEAHISAFPQEIAMMVKDMEMAAEHGLYFHNPNDLCSWCSYFSVCTMLQDAADPTEYIQMYFQNEPAEV
jgi:CRISPR/Cas system-associated exonuclease Cas4 (RecB family)